MAVARVAFLSTLWLAGVGLTGVGLTTGTCTAQDPSARRYELGKRLIRFEERLAAIAPTHPGRGDAIAAMERAVRSFFGLDLTAAASAIDDGCHALADDAAKTATARDLLAIAPLLRTRVAAPSATVELAVTGVRESILPLELTVEIDGRRERVVLVAPKDDDGPWLGEWTAPDREGDHAVGIQLTSGGVGMHFPRQILSVVRDAAARAAALAARLVDLPRTPELERSTVEFLLRQAGPVLAGRTLETDLRLFAVLARAESLAASLTAGAPRIGSADPGDHLLRVPLGARGAVVRIFVPAALPAAADRRLVLALHGAGGSENLFFDGYGAGLGVRLSAAQGAIFVAPRNLAAGDVEPLITALAERFEVPRGAVDVVGHSMGAATALAAVERSPQHFRHVALVGGGGRARNPDAVAPVPCLLVTGGRDFARAQVLSTFRTLRGVAHPAVELIEFPWVEHMLVVQVALPDVFAFFAR
jgi:pimeloyl-ACP methyl ester carboxylesterase